MLRTTALKKYGRWRGSKPLEQSRQQYARLRRGAMGGSDYEGD
jgi:hypothetical protein